MFSILHYHTHCIFFNQYNDVFVHVINKLPAAFSRFLLHRASCGQVQLARPTIYLPGAIGQLRISTPAVLLLRKRDDQNIIYMYMYRVYQEWMSCQWWYMSLCHSYKMNMNDLVIQWEDALVPSVPLLKTMFQASHQTLPTSTGNLNIQQTMSMLIGNMYTVCIKISAKNQLDLENIKTTIQTLHQYQRQNIKNYTWNLE